MSFFENIIADSRRKIIPVQDDAPITQVAPKDNCTSDLSVSDLNERKINTPDIVTNNDAGMLHFAKPNETQVGHEALFESVANKSRGKTSDPTDFAANFISSAQKTFKPSAVDENNLTPSSVPTMQLKANTNSRSETVSSAVSSNNSYKKYNPSRNKKQLSFSDGNRQESLARHQHPLQDKQVIKQDFAASNLPKLKVKSQNSKAWPHNIEPGEENRMMADHLNTEREHSEQTIQSTPAMTEVQNVSATILTKNRAALPKESERPHIEANNKKQPRVQIGQVNVVIEQKDTPNRRANKIIERDDYVSRNFLKSL